MSDIVTHITVNGDRKQRLVSDQDYERGLQHGQREGYKARVKEELTTPRLLPFWDNCLLLRDNETITVEGPGWHLDLTRDEALELSAWLDMAARDQITDPIDHDAERKAAIEEAM